MAKCIGCGNDAKTGFKLENFSSVVSFCSSRCFDAFFEFDISTHGNIIYARHELIELSPEDYTAYCAMEAL